VLGGTPPLVERFGKLAEVCPHVPVSASWHAGGLICEPLSHCGRCWATVPAVFPTLLVFPVLFVISPSVYIRRPDG
jgi:hypothetical protein